MLMHRLNLTGVVAVLVLAVAATVLAVRKPSETDRSLRDDGAANVEARWDVNDEASVIVAGGATSCESLGGVFQFFSFASIYRGNEVRFESEATLLSFCMELSFVGTTDLHFSIHRRVSENSFERLAGVPDVILPDESGTGEAQFYCTDQADVPPGPILLRPADYVFGVAWGNRTEVTFFRDSLFDPSFIVGRVEGAIGLNGISPPLEDPLVLLPADSRFAHSMEICLAPEPGACCSKRLVGNCQEIFENGEDGLGGCTGPGEFFHGQRSRCDETICRFGACCTECQVCNEDYAKEACQSPGDVWHLNTDCPAEDDEQKELCPGITGACCDGTVCKDLCETKCIELDGTYFGDGSVCEMNQCTGACLTCDSGECRQRSEFTCETFVQGVYKGAGTSCVRPEPQDECGGPCCFYDGGTADPICINVDFRAECIAQKGQRDILIYLGDGKDDDDPDDPVCASTTSCPADPDTRFACCLPEGDCIDVLSTDACDAMFGEPNTSLKCEAINCRGLRVACCFADGNCELLMGDACSASGGHSSGEDVCDPDPCPGSEIPEVTGVCCGTDRGVCDVTTELVCLGRGEFFQGTQTDICGIAEEACPGFGACCRENGECFDDVTPDECTLILDGTYAQDGSRCSDLELTCSVRGACCTIFGSCVLASDGECSAIDGVFEGVGVACTSDTCDSGACCVDDGRCEPRRRDRCVDLDRFAGNGTACPDGVCTRGACCLINGDCLPDEPAFACTGNKLFTAESTCEALDPSCEGETPCCFIDGSCELLRPAECEADNGIPQRGVAECSTGLCTAGACCSPEHECEDDAFALSCVAQTDHTFHEGESCPFDRPCDPVGVCCVGGTCSVITEFECSLQLGVFSADLLDCTGDPPCALGACCQETQPDVFACRNAFLRMECAAATDIFHEGADCGLDRPCDPTGACCVDGACTDDEPQTLCEDANGRFRGEGSQCDVSCGACGPDQILASDPPNCTIDAAYPHQPNDSQVRLGITSVEITLDCNPAGLEFQDFGVRVDPPDVGAPPIDAITTVDENTVMVTFGVPIPPGHWTCVEVLTAGQEVCVGSLPGDVNGSGMSSGVDLVALLDHFNGVTLLQLQPCDVDRDGECAQADILAAIDLLEGVGAFDPWAGMSLPVCPSAP